MMPNTVLKRGPLVLLGLVMLLSVAIAEHVPHDELGFTNFVAAQLRGQVSDAEVVVKGPLTLGLAGLQLNLDRIFTFCRGNGDHCSAEVDNYVKGAAETYRSQHAAPTKEAVRLVLRTAQYVDTLRSAATGSQPMQMQSRPFVEGLYVLPVIDNPRTVRMLGEEDNVKLGLTADEVFELGMVNVRQELPPLMSVAKVAGHGQIGQITGSVYNPSRLILVDSWAPLAEVQGGVLIVTIPATDAVFYVGEDTPKAIDALRSLSKIVLARAPSKLSGDLYRWRPSGWERVP
jgi:hypothetical protein